jgi:hypothetical protein
MHSQFLQVADEEGWDLERQIALLDDFFSGFGASARVDDYLAAHGLGFSTRYHRAALRDRLLDLVSLLGAEGALTRMLQRELRHAAEAAARERAEAAAQAAAQRKLTEASSRVSRRSVLGWLRRRAQGVSTP